MNFKYSPHTKLHQVGPSAPRAGAGDASRRAATAASLHRAWEQRWAS